MENQYRSIKSMKEVSEQIRKIRRQYLRYQQAEIVYSLSHKKLLELASDAGAIYRFDGTVLINKEIFDQYLEQFHEPALKKSDTKFSEKTSESSCSKKKTPDEKGAADGR